MLMNNNNNAANFKNKNSKENKHKTNDKSSNIKHDNLKTLNSKQNTKIPPKDKIKQPEIPNIKSPNDNDQNWYTATNKNEKRPTKNDNTNKPSTSALDHISDDRNREQVKPSTSVVETAVKLIDMNKITVDTLSDIPLSSYGNLNIDFSDDNSVKNQNQPSISNTVTKNSNRGTVNKTGDKLKDFILEHLPAARIANKTTSNIILQQPDNNKTDTARDINTEITKTSEGDNTKPGDRVKNTKTLNDVNVTKINAQTNITNVNQTSELKTNSAKHNHNMQLLNNYLPNKMYSSGFPLSPSFVGYTQYQQLRSANFYYGQYQIPLMGFNRQPFQQQNFNYWSRFPQQPYPIATIPLVSPKFSSFYSPSSYFTSGETKFPNQVTGGFRNSPSVIIGEKEKSKRGIFPFPDVISKDEQHSNNNDDSRPHKEYGRSVKTDQMLTHFFEKQTSKNP